MIALTDVILMVGGVILGCGVIALHDAWLYRDGSRSVHGAILVLIAGCFVFLGWR